MQKETSSSKIVTTNRKAHYNYFLSEFLECGIELTGTEIKSIRLGQCSINDAYVIITNGEAYVLNMHISHYDKGTYFNQDPLRDRKLLMHKKEILRYEQKVATQGCTIVPTKVYLSKGKCKVEIALAKGKKLFDKREDIKKRDNKREIDRTIKSNKY